MINLWPEVSDRWDWRKKKQFSLARWTKADVFRLGPCRPPVLGAIREADGDFLFFILVAGKAAKLVTYREASRVVCRLRKAVLYL